MMRNNSVPRSRTSAACGALPLAFMCFGLPSTARGDTSEVDPQSEPASEAVVAAKIDPADIRKGVWRGRVWFSLAASMGGPLGGEGMAKPTVLAIGGAVQIGYRPFRWLGVYTAAALHPHDTAGVSVVSADGRVREAQIARSVIHFDLASIRWFAPVKGHRLQPHVDIGGGVFLLPHRTAATRQAGGSLRAAGGTDLWIGRSLSLSADLVYRLKRLDRQSGHSLTGMLGLTLHR